MFERKLLHEKEEENQREEKTCVESVKLEKEESITVRVAAFEEHCWVLFAMKVDLVFPLDTYSHIYLGPKGLCTYNPCLVRL